MLDPVSSPFFMNSVSSVVYEITIHVLFPLYLDLNIKHLVNFKYILRSNQRRHDFEETQSDGR